MIELSRDLSILFAALSGLWLGLALWVTLSARRRGLLARRAMDESAAMTSLVASSPSLALILRRDLSLDGPERLAATLGAASLPGQWSSFVSPEGCLGEYGPVLESHADKARLGETFMLHLRPHASSRTFRVSGGPAPPALGEGSVLLWFTDVTDMEEEIAALRGRLERRSAALKALSGLIEAAPFPMWHRGPDLRLAMVNEAYVGAVEAEDAQTVVRDGIELLDAAEGPDPIGAAAMVRESGEASHRTVPATIAGERRTVHIVEVPLGPEGVAGYAIDVDDQEQAKAELSRFVRAQREMLDRLSAGVAHFSRDRGLIFYNQAFARLFSLTAEFLGDGPEFDRVMDAMREAGNLPEVRDFPAWKAEHRRWFTGGIAADEEDWLLPGGRHLRVVAQPLPDGGLLVIFEDRTEQIQLASARDTLLRVRAATFDNLFEAVGVFASDGRLHLWNNRFCELWGFEEEQLSGHPRVDALTPHIAARLKKAGHAGLVRELVRSATTERKQRAGRVSLKDGREFEFAAVPLPDGNALFTMLDVTDSRKVEIALRDRNEALEEADRMKTAFVSNMSYELRTPLTSIAGFAEMLAGGYAGDLPPTASEYVTAILDSVARLGVMIDNVLDLTQSDSGSLLLAEEELDVATLCSAVAAELQDAAERKGVALICELVPESGKVTGDRRRLGQAIGNVLQNAISYTDPGGRVTIRAEGGRGAARIIVSDNGRGIAPADQARVFDRFHRTVGRESGEGVAAGLGLPLARQFVEAHGGSIGLKSEPGKGTIVILTLPRTIKEKRVGRRAGSGATA